MNLQSKLALVGAMLVAVGGFAAEPAAAQPRAAQGFSIEQVLSAPFPSGLLAAGQGGRVAWVSNDKGSRNVWVAEPGKAGAHAITSYAGDDGFDLGELNWSPDGRQVLYTRGGSLEGGGPVNVLSRPSGAAAQEIWAASVDAGAPRRIATGRSPVVSPRGDQVAYVLGGQIWTAPLASAGAPAQLIHDRGRSDGLVWSPDGSRLAFTSARGDHGFVGVYDVAAKAIVWLGPSVDRDLAPEWSPDGKSVAFIRIPAGRGFSFTERREGQPWSIWVADAATGAARQAWIAPAGPGSVFHALEVERNLFWTATGRLVFAWERSGWLQLYAISPTGGAPSRLSVGDAEVFSVSLSADRRRIVYSSNQGDIDHRHIWEVAADGAPRQLTQGPTIEDSPAVTSDGQVVALHGDWRKPMRPVRLSGPGRLDDLAAGATPPNFPDAQFTEPRQVVFDAPDGVKVHGQLFLPPPGHAARGPAILFFHGGPIRQMLLGWHPMDAYTYMYGLNQYLARQGYTVLSVNYRGGSGYGLDFREALKFGAGGASELNDIMGGVNFLRARPDVDPKRIGIWGGSYGGLMTALGLSRASEYLAAGVDYAGVHDWTRMGNLFTDPSAPKGAAELAFNSSALATIDKWTSPVLVVHADDDRNVPFSQTVQLVEALRQHHVEVEQVILPDEIHDLLREASWLTFFHAAADFFDRRLGAASQPPAARR